MKVLLDENLPHDLRLFLPGHDVYTVAFMGWKGLDNGALLAAAAEHGFDAVVSLDSGLEHQQPSGELPVGVVLLRAMSNKLDALRPLVPALLRALAALPPRTLVIVAA